MSVGVKQWFEANMINGLRRLLIEIRWWPQVKHGQIYSKTIQRFRLDIFFIFLKVGINII